MKQAFEKVTLNKSSRAFLETVNGIISDYAAQGYTLTLRQLYYQLVSRDLIANKVTEYNKLSRVLTKARMSGLVDWSAIEDRLRVPKRLPAWESPKEILESAAKQFALDKLEGQDVHVEVWVEKDALSQIVERIANKYHVRTLVNRGYGSVSAIYAAYRRFKYKDTVRVLYLGDHDPSGLDMVRDIRDRINFMLDHDTITDFEIEAIALTRDQINQYNPPTNPAKFSDPRGTGYVNKHGRYSWEVDALEPKVLSEIIEKNIVKHLDLKKFDSIKIVEDLHKIKLEKIANDYSLDNGESED